MDNFTIEEHIEILGNDLQQAIAKSELPISVVFLIIKEIAKQLEEVYNQRQPIIFENINNKILQMQNQEAKEE